jgi:hypothetical protein
MKDASATDKKRDQEATGDKAVEEPSDCFYGKLTRLTPLRSLPHHHHDV